MEKDSVDWVDKEIRFNAHPSRDSLEEYAFNRLSESATESLEEHLLVCAGCQDQLREVDEYILLMKRATAAQLARQRAKPEKARRRWMQWCVLGAAVASMVLVMAVRLPVERPGIPQQVSLAAFRGDQAARAGAGRPIEVMIDASDLPASSDYMVQVVNASGREISKSAAVSSEGKLTARVSNGLSRGVYWVRLYTSAGDLLREYGLRAE